MIKSVIKAKAKKSKAKKSKKKDSFINDSSEEETIFDSEEEYLPNLIKTRAACRKMTKITPQKKSVYNCLNENSKSTRKKNSKSNVKTDTL